MGSCVAYVQLGWFVGPRFRRLPSRVPLRQAGPRFVEKHGLERFRTAFPSASVILSIPGQGHLRTGLELLRRSFTHSAGSRRPQICGLCLRPFGNGSPCRWTSARRRATRGESGLEFRERQSLVTSSIYYRTTQVHPDSPGPDPSFSRSTMRRSMRAGSRSTWGDNPHSVFAACWYWIRKLQVHFYAGD